MKYVTLKEFKKINKKFFDRELAERGTIFYNQSSTEKKFTAVENIGSLCSSYMDAVYECNDKERTRARRKLYRALKAGKIVIRKGQKGFDKNIGIKEVFSPFHKFIDLLGDNNKWIGETKLKAFFTRIYDYADYKIGIYLN